LFDAKIRTLLTFKRIFLVFFKIFFQFLFNLLEINVLFCRKKNRSHYKIVMESKSHLTSFENILRRSQNNIAAVQFALQSH